MKLFGIIYANPLFLQGSASANGDELISKVASEVAEANEILATAHGGASTSPVNPWDDFLQPISFAPSFGSVDSEFSFRSNSDFSHGSIEAHTKEFSALQTAKQKLKAALGKLNIATPVELFEAANEHKEVKQALNEAFLAILEQDTERALTPAEVRFFNAKQDLVSELVKAKVYGPDGELTKKQLVDAANRNPTVSKAYQKILEAKRQLVTEPRSAVPEAAQKVKEALEEVTHAAEQEQSASKKARLN